MFDIFRSRRSVPPETKGSVLQELIAFHAGGNARWSPRDAKGLLRNGFARNPIVFACVTMIAEAASSVRLRVQDRRGPLEGHSLDSILTFPNPDQSGAMFFETLFGHLAVSGNAYIEVVDGADGPAALYLLRPDCVSVECGRDGWPVAWVHESSGRKRRLSRNEEGRAPVIHVRLFNPSDDVYGQSPISAAADAIDLHNAATSWNKSLLDNAARPSGALIYRGTSGSASLTGDQFERLKRELSDTYGGAERAGRPMVLDGGLDWKPMSMSPAEMDFRELKNGAARDIALAFGVPSMLLGIPGDNTYANYAQANIAFWRQTVLPMVGKVAAAIGVLITESDVLIGYDEHRIDALHQSRVERLKLLLDAADVTPAEKRLALGLPESPDPETSWAMASGRP